MDIKVYDKNSGELLKSFHLDDAEKAYQYSAELENLGIEAQLKIPSVGHSLLDSLGASEEDLSQLTIEQEKEIASHGSCCGPIDNGSSREQELNH